LQTITIRITIGHLPFGRATGVFAPVVDATPQGGRMEKERCYKQARKPEAAPWWYLAVVVALVGVMFFVVLRLMPAMA
jgi:hypothetical protein